MQALSSDGRQDFRNFLEAAADSLPEQKRHTEFGLALLQALREKGHTQASFAEKLGCSRQWINHIVKGKENLTQDTIQKLETALEMRLQHFYAQAVPQKSTTVAAVPVTVSFKAMCSAICEKLFSPQPVKSRQFQAPILANGAARADRAGYENLASAATYASAQC